jgi:amino acid transporter
MLPPIFAKETASGNLFWNTLIIGIIMTLIAIFVPFSILWDMISLGVLLSFCLTNSSLIAVRYAGPEGNMKLTIIQVCK